MKPVFKLESLKTSSTGIVRNQLNWYQRKSVLLELLEMIPAHWYHEMKPDELVLFFDTSWTGFIWYQLNWVHLIPLELVSFDTSSTGFISVQLESLETSSTGIKWNQFNWDQLVFSKQLNPVTSWTGVNWYVPFSVTEFHRPVVNTVELVSNETSWYQFNWDQLGFHNYNKFQLDLVET